MTASDEDLIIDMDPELSLIFGTDPAGIDTIRVYYKAAGLLAKWFDTNTIFGIFDRKLNSPAWESIREGQKKDLASVTTQIRKRMVVSALDEDISQESLDKCSRRSRVEHFIMNELKKSVAVISVSGNVYMYSDGIYVNSPDTIPILSKLIIQIGQRYGLELPSNFPDKVIALLAHVNSVETINCEPDGDRVIVCNNGVLDIGTGDFSPHDPKKIYFSKLPVDYMPNAQPPVIFTRYIESTFRGNEQQLKLAQEIFGYTLMKKYIYQRIFYLVGEGGNGKGVFVQVLTSMLGKQNVTSCSMKDLTGFDSFRNIATMRGKFANICGDGGYDPIKDTAIIKMLSGGDFVHGRQVYEKAIEFVSYATLIFLFNRLPTKPAFSRGDNRRDVILNFVNSIGDTKNDIKGLAELIIESGGMPGILNWALDGLRRLVRQGDFTDPRSISQRAIEYDRKSHPMAHFVNDCVFEIEGNNKDDGTPAEQVYQAYEMYRRPRGMPAMNKNEIGAELRKECLEIGIHTSKHRTSGTRKPDGKRCGQIMIFQGIEIILPSDNPSDSTMQSNLTSYANQ